MFVVSANYRDRHSPYRWLIRQAGDPLEKARACRRVELRSEVGLVQSSDGEEGFGCRRVALCEDVVGYEFEDEAKALTVADESDGYVPVEWDGLNFVAKFGDSEKYIGSAKMMRLEANGKIFAAGPVAKA